MLAAELNPVLEALADEGLADSVTVVLVGSGARGVRNPRSDIDVLVLHGDDRRIRLKRPGDVHLQQDSRSRFLKRLEDGDDYPGWALRLGTPLRDPGGWWAENAAAESGNPHWPDWRPKLEHARKRIRMASELLESWRRGSGGGRVHVHGQSCCEVNPAKGGRVPSVAP